MGTLFWVSALLWSVWQPEQTLFSTLGHAISNPLLSQSIWLHFPLPLFSYSFSYIFGYILLALPVCLPFYLSFFFSLHSITLTHITLIVIISFLWIYEDSFYLYKKFKDQKMEAWWNIKFHLFHTHYTNWYCLSTLPACYLAVWLLSLHVLKVGMVSSTGNT